MTEKEKELDRFFMSGVTCDKKMERAKKHIKAACKELKENQDATNQTDEHAQRQKGVD